MFPFCPFPPRHRKSKSRWSRLVDRILAAKAQGREQAADVSAWERELDELVYALYGLSKEEKALVQATAK